MKFKHKKSLNTTLSEKIADALTVKPRADIEDDQVFGTKPQTVTRADFSSSDSEDDAAISDFRKRNVNLLSEISKKYEGQVVAKKDLKSGSDDYEQSDSDDGINSKDLSLFESEDSSDDSIIKNGAPEKNGEHASDSSDSDDEKIPQKRCVDKLEKVTNENQKRFQVKGFKDISSDDDEESEKNTLHENQGIDSLMSIFKNNKKLKSKPSSDSEDSATDDDKESNDYGITKLYKQVPGSNDSENDNDDDEEDESDGDNDDDGEGYDISQMEEPAKEEFQHVKKQNVSEEAKKGACVRNQLLIWEGLLEMRIHLQRCVNTANQMPMPDTHEELKLNHEFAEECNASKANITTVLDKMMTLQNILFKNFPETKTLCSKKQTTETKEVKEESDEEIPSDTDNEEIPSDTDAEDDATTKPEQTPSKKNVNSITSKKRKLQDYECEISTTHKAFKTFRDSTIQKWNDKTRLATATNIKNTPTNTILQQISYILSDKEKLVRRTQLKRSEYDIVGHKTQSNSNENRDENSEANPITKDRKHDDEYIPEIFDDSDFYHQLLRELIECKSADISDPVQLSRQWIALQQMRSKMKRKVDTKATKGRKIKYVVHNKLVNYMAPEKCTTWTDESTNELYSSLFGKMFENNNIGLNVNIENGFKLKNY